MQSPLEDLIAVGILIFGGACLAMLWQTIRMTVYAVKKRFQKFLLKRKV